MRTFKLASILLIFITTNVFASTSIDCSNYKKNSPKYLLCKTKSAGSSIKNKMAKDNKKGKKSFFKKFKDAKTLNDLLN